MEKSESESAVSILRDLLFPPKCVCCKSLLERGTGRVFCDICYSKFDMARRLVCRHCGREMQNCSCCGDILIKSGVYRVARAVAYYPERKNAPEHALIHAAKRKRLSHVWRFMASEMAKAVKRMPESINGFCVTYIPRRQKAVREYGFDHSREISIYVAEELGVPWEETLCRAPHSGEQKGLSRKERESNAAVTVLPINGISVSGKRYIIVDDILTTGASLSAGGAVLKALGAVEVRCAVFAYRG